MATVTIDRADIQGLIVRGHGALRAARYVLARIAQPAGASSWLAALADEVDDGRDRPNRSAVNVALTPSGLRKLGLPAETLAMFSREFTGGMTTAHRSRILGDVEESAPERWSWGGPRGEEIDVLLLLYAADEAEMSTVLTARVAALEAGGLRVVRTLDTSPLVDYEHFGFRDGVSQPRMEEIGEAPDAHTVKAGEFILGYPNGYGQFTPRPLLDTQADPHGMLPPAPEAPGNRDLGRGGSYLVLRQLSQDVRAFWEFCDRATRRPDGSADHAARVRLASKIVGRWPSGAPLVLAPESDRPELAEENDFGYFAEDRHGLRCPIGAHVRRSHPRDSLDPKPGSHKSIEVGNRHRLLRRGRQYGPFVSREELLSMDAPERWDAEPRGLHFICLVGNLSRQFEFVQHTWLNNPRFDGLYDTPDPLMSPAPPGGRRFTVPAKRVRERYNGLPRFVSVRGGAYFFLPGIRALRYLAALNGGTSAGSA
ncbi:MAG: peroxidase [Chloroflexota bacterium]|nr:peroxidase [Chloroflexota bacterium]